MEIDVPSKMVGQNPYQWFYEKTNYQNKLKNKLKNIYQEKD